MNGLTLFESGHRDDGRACLAEGIAMGRELRNPLLLWIGGLLMAAGTALAGFPGRRRRVPTDPVSKPIELEPAGV